MMSRKHYIIIADVFNKRLTDVGLNQHHKEGIASVGLDLATALKKDNPRFNIPKFIQDMTRL